MRRRKPIHIGVDEPLAAAAPPAPDESPGVYFPGLPRGCAGLLGTSLYSLMGSRAHAISPDLLDPAFTNYSTCDLGKVAAARFRLSVLTWPVVPTLPAVT